MTFCGLNGKFADCRRFFVPDEHSFPLQPRLSEEARRGRMATAYSALMKPLPPLPFW